MSFGGGQSSQQTTTQTNEPWGPLGDFLKFGFGQLRNAYDSGGLAPPPYPGNTVAPFDPLQLMGQSAAANYLLGPDAQNYLSGQFQNIGRLEGGLDPSVNPLLQQAMPLLSGANQATNFQMLGALDPRFNPALAQSLSGAQNAGQTLQELMKGGSNPYIDLLVNQAQRDLIQGFDKQQNPQLEAAATAAGQAGSSRHGVAEGLARQQLTQEMGDVSTNLRSKLYESGQNRALQAVNSALGNLNTAYGQGLNAQNAGAQNAFGLLGRGADLGFTAMGRGAALAPSFYQLPLQSFQALSDIGGQRQGLQQAKIQELIDRYNQNSSTDLRSLQNLFGLLTGSGAGSFGTSTTNAPGPRHSAIAGGAGGALSGLALSSMLSASGGTAVALPILGALAGLFG